MSALPRRLSPMKFIADGMLGKLAKRLRLLGFDVLYDPSLEDREVIRCALEQDRVILTRDTRLAMRPLASSHILVRGDRVQDQVGQILAGIPLAGAQKALTRCSRCNHLLQPVSRQVVRDLVPAHIYGTQRDFLGCSGCGRIYWRGSHLKRMGQKNSARWSGGPPAGGERPR